MKDFIRDLRKRLGLNQTKFAELLGVSYPSLQNYEAGRNVPDPVIFRLHEIAMESGFADLASMLGDPGAVSTPHTLPVRPPHPGPPVYNPKNKEFHDMLEEVLESGDPDARGAVIPNLVLFSKYVRGLTRQKQSKKSTDKRRNLG